jgi:hypothetical protein
VSLAGQGRAAFLRLGYFLRTWTARVRHLFMHLAHPVRFVWYRLRKEDPRQKLYRINPAFWTLGLILLILDLFGIPELYESLAEFFKPGTRPLLQEEIRHYGKVFGEEIEWSLVRVDSQARVGPRQYRIAYVSFHTINSWGPLSRSVMVHELVHVWQYQKFGSLYIALALQAQLSAEGYDYGGTRQLIRQQGIPFTVAFNFEQQAEVVEDFYRSMQHLPLQWSDPSPTTGYWLTYWVRRGLTGNQFDPTD